MNNSTLKNKISTADRVQGGRTMTTLFMSKTEVTTKNFQQHSYEFNGKHDLQTPFKTEMSDERVKV